jgi:hypothetical protein
MEDAFPFIFDERIGEKQCQRIKNEYLEVQAYCRLLGKDHHEKDDSR